MAFDKESDESYVTAEEADPHTAEAHCPRCGAPAERGQLVCLECGSRIALTYKRPPRWEAAVAIAVAVFALFLLAALVAVAAIGYSARREVDAAPPRPKAKPQPAKKKPPKPAGDDSSRPSTAPATDIVQRGALYTWPGDLVGFTVVINSTEDRASATTYAQSAAKSRPAKIGVIHADDFRTVPKGFYIVFAGRYETRAEADQATARLGRRFKGAFTQRVAR